MQSHLHWLPALQAAGYKAFVKNADPQYFVKVLSQAAQATGGLGSSCCITQDYKEMYWDFNDLGKSYDLIMKLKINVLYL